ncbi:hypothetical protein [Streptomyces sp. NPDC059215]|uniref:hypothetical protein n=1 Tax=Streptomyces sp. NPDC059215 TaxID=3346772 RepID=UPI00369D1911
MLERAEETTTFLCSPDSAFSQDLEMDSSPHALEPGVVDRDGRVFVNHAAEYQGAEILVLAADEEDVVASRRGKSRDTQRPIMLL